MIGEGHTVTIPLRGYSMRPFLEDGRDKAVLAAADNIRKGDVVLAEICPGQYVLHRIINIADDRIKLLGDGNITPEYCLRRDIKAIATAFYRKGRNTADSTEGRKWQTYSHVWMFLRPIRRVLLKVMRLQKRIYNITNLTGKHNNENKKRI